MKYNNSKYKSGNRQKKSSLGRIDSGKSGIHSISSKTSNNSINKINKISDVIASESSDSTYSPLPIIKTSSMSTDEDENSTSSVSSSQISHVSEQIHSPPPVKRNQSRVRFHISPSEEDVRSVNVYTPYISPADYFKTVNKSAAHSPDTLNVPTSRALVPVDSFQNGKIVSSQNLRIMSQPTGLDRKFASQTSLAVPVTMRDGSRIKDPFGSGYLKVENGALVIDQPDFENLMREMQKKALYVSIASIFCCCFVLSIPAVILACRKPRSATRFTYRTSIILGTIAIIMGLVIPAWIVSTTVTHGSWTYSAQSDSHSSSAVTEAPAEHHH